MLDALPAGGGGRAAGEPRRLRRAQRRARPRRHALRDRGRRRRPPRRRRAGRHAGAARRRSPARASPTATMRFFGAWEGELRFPDYDPYRLLYRHTIGLSALMRREVIEDTGGFDPAFESYEDWELWLNALAHGWRGRRVDAVTLEYRRHAGTLEARARTAGATAATTPPCGASTRRSTPAPASWRARAASGPLQRARVSLVLGRAAGSGAAGGVRAPAPLRPRRLIGRPGRYPRRRSAVADGATRVRSRPFSLETAHGKIHAIHRSWPSCRRTTRPHRSATVVRKLQTHAPGYDVLVVDDGSTDATAQDRRGRRRARAAAPVQPRHRRRRAGGLPVRARQRLRLRRPGGRRRPARSAARSDAWRRRCAASASTWSAGRAS